MKNYDQMFMDIAERTAVESNCVKYKVGAVVVKDNRIILQGYNGTPSGFENCNHVFNGYDMKNTNNRLIHREWSKDREVHAEMNIICYAAKKGISLENTTLYITLKPCNNCLKHIISSGIKNVIYLHEKNNQNIPELMKMINIRKYGSKE